MQKEKKKQIRKLDIKFCFHFLQNIHLVAKWLSTLEKKLEATGEGSHPDYRVFMSAEPAGTPESHYIPQVRT